MQTTVQSEKYIRVRISPDMAFHLEEMKKATGINKSTIATRVLDENLRADAGRVRDIMAAIKEADAGNFMSEEEVNSFFAKYGC